MNRVFLEDDDLDVSDLAATCAQTAVGSDFPNCSKVVSNVVIYDGPVLRKLDDDPGGKVSLMTELTHCLKDGPGVLVIRNAYHDVSVVEQSTNVLHRIVEREQAESEVRGDHFGENERLWNSLQKACLEDPDLFIDYYGNPLLRLVSEAWLGPHYQVTAQMNNVKPNGAAQRPHRDYHLGFQTADVVGRFPLHAQWASQFLTLQGAVAHADMPLEKGPTLVLPYSQLYEPGYLAYHKEEFAHFFLENHAQLPLAMGDMVFFNPAVLHAGGSNSTDSDRVANLLQVSSAFGQTMETIDCRKMIEAVYPELQKRRRAGAPEQLLRDTVAVVASGYAFPTNLDSDPPIGGNAPRTQQQIVWDMLQYDCSLADVRQTLDEYDERRRA